MSPASAPAAGRPAPTRLYALGPAGTFSDHAAQRVRANLGLGEVPVVYTRTIPEVLARTEAEPGALGVFPIENSVAGTVTAAQDSLVRHRTTILWELALQVRFSLLANAPLERVARYYAHPQAFDQCSEYLATHLAQAEVRFTNSNVESGRTFLTEAEQEPVGAIVPHEFAAPYGGWLAAEDIQDFANNTTRFLVVRRADAEERFDFTRAKTTVLIEPDEDRPGLLYDLLSVFKAHDVNLTRLESRPAKVTPWVYVFYLDFNNNPSTPACIDELRRTTRHVTILGSYDRLE